MSEFVERILLLLIVHFPLLLLAAVLMHRRHSRIAAVCLLLGAIGGIGMLGWLRDARKPSLMPAATKERPDPHLQRNEAFFDEALVQGRPRTARLPARAREW